MNPQSVLSQSETPMDPYFGWDLGSVIDVMRRRVWLLALLPVVSLALGGVYLACTPPIFEARTTVQVEQQAPPVVSGQDAREDLKTADVLKTIEQNLSNTALLLRVAKVNSLAEDARFTGEKKGLLARLTALVKSSPATPLTDAGLTRALSDRVKVSLRRGTRLIDVVVSGQDPELARQISQSIVSEYARLNFEQKLESSRPAYEYLVGEAGRLKAKLGESEQKLQAYREEKRAVSLEQTQNIVVETLKDLNKSLSEARSRRMKVESDVASITALQSRPDALMALAGIGASPDVILLKQRITEQEAALASMAERYDSRNPKHLQAQSEIEKLKHSLTRAVQDSAEVVKASLGAAQETERKLVLALQEQEKQALDLNKISIGYNVLTREVESDRLLYESVLKQLKETQIIQGVDQGAIRVVEPATVPDRPVSPKKSMVLALALFAGVASGSVMALGPALFRAPLSGADEAERQLGLPAVGVIPRVRVREGGHHILLVDHPRSPAAEALRSLRASLTLKHAPGEGRSYLFCSAFPQEGKTFCAVNFAAALALEGHRTLLIDADLRVPGIGLRLLGKEPPEGFATVLQGKVKLGEVVQPSKLPNLHILPAGSEINGPAELLASPLLGTYLASALEEYDRVVVDSAPVLAVSDAMRLVGHVQHTCLVIHAGVTPGRAVRRAARQLTAAAGRPLVGFVLNKTSQSPVGYGTYGS